MDSPVITTSLGALYDGDGVALLGFLADQSIDLLILDPPGEDALEAALAVAPRILRPTGSVLVFGLSTFIAEVKVRHAKRFDRVAWLIWYHGRSRGNGRDFASTHESILHLRGERFAPRRVASDSAPCGDVFNVPPPSGREKTIHPTQKPVTLIRSLIEVATKPGDLVVDPFAGSGTTVVACETIGRSWIGCEIAADYRALIERRTDALGGSQSRARKQVRLSHRSPG